MQFDVPKTGTVWESHNCSGCNSHFLHLFFFASQVYDSGMRKCALTTVQSRQQEININRRTLRSGGESARLRDGDVLSFVGGGDVALRCKTGILWITQENDPRDHILSQRESFIPDQRGRIVVWAMSDAVVLLKLIHEET